MVFVLEEPDHARFKRDKGDLIMNMVSISVTMVNDHPSCPYLIRK